MKTIVVYYSRKGSNKYLAEKITTSLSCDIEKIRPHLNVFLFFLMNINLGIRPVKHKLTDYNKVILYGPVWMGKFILPLRSFLDKYKDNIHELIFVTCCGSPDAKKDEKFGHGIVFREIETIMGNKCTMCRAFPIDLVVPDDKKENPEAIMKTRLSDTNFNGVIKERFDQMIATLSEN
jgi:menaquinone-dependent protoporphyrinogen IX oxidase